MPECNVYSLQMNGKTVCSVSVQTVPGLGVKPKLSRKSLRNFVTAALANKVEPPAGIAPATSGLRNRRTATCA